MTLISKELRKKYLNSKPFAYQIGWFAGESGGCESIKGSPKQQYYYEKGYKESVSNSKDIKGEVTNDSTQLGGA